MQQLAETLDQNFLQARVDAGRRLRIEFLRGGYPETAMASLREQLYINT